MQDKDKSKVEVMNELEELDQCIDSLKNSEADRCRLEQEVAEMKFFYERILDGLVDGVWITNKDDMIHYTNRGMEIISGMEQEENN